MSRSGSPSKLSQHLLSTFREGYLTATQAPFLAACGDGSVDRDTLTHWLRQDLCYASLGYPRAMGHLISKLNPSPIDAVNFQSLSGGVTGRAALHTRCVNVIAESLLNITREIAMFVDALKKYDFIEVEPGSPDGEGIGGLVKLIEPNTQAYLDFMIATACSHTIEESMVLLWAMEKCYLDAWSFAKESLKKRVSSGKSSSVQSASAELIENWTSEPFRRFVQTLEEIVDDLPVSIDPQNELYCKVEATFRHVLWLEDGFWPKPR